MFSHSGEEAYLRTKQVLDEAATVSSMLFLDEDDMAKRYRRAYEREDAVDSADVASAASNGFKMPEIAPANPGAEPPSFRGKWLFLPAGEVDGGGGGGEFSNGFGGGVLNPAGSGAREAVERRPEETFFCDAFLDLQSLLVR